MSIKRWMILVSIVAFLLATVSWVQKREQTFARMALEYRGKIVFSRDFFPGCGGLTERKQNYYCTLRNKYEDAAQQPWWPVPPDPPEPE